MTSMPLGSDTVLGVLGSFLYHTRLSWAAFGCVSRVGRRGRERSGSPERSEGTKGLQDSKIGCRV